VRPATPVGPARLRARQRGSYPDAASAHSRRRPACAAAACPSAASDFEPTPFGRRAAPPSLRPRARRRTAPPQRSMWRAEAGAPAVRARLRRQHLPQQHAERVAVRGRGQHAALQHLWRLVRERAAPARLDDGARGHGPLSASKIGHLRAGARGGRVSAQQASRASLLRGALRAPPQPPRAGQCAASQEYAGLSAAAGGGAPRPRAQTRGHAAGVRLHAGHPRCAGSAPRPAEPPGRQGKALPAGRCMLRGARLGPQPARAQRTEGAPPREQHVAGRDVAVHLRGRLGCTLRRRRPAPSPAPGVGGRARSPHAVPARRRLAGPRRCGPGALLQCMRSDAPALRRPALGPPRARQGGQRRARALAPPAGAAGLRVLGRRPRAGAHQAVGRVQVCQRPGNVQRQHNNKQQARPARAPRVQQPALQRPLQGAWARRVCVRPRARAGAWCPVSGIDARLRTWPRTRPRARVPTSPARPHRLAMLAGPFTAAPSLSQAVQRCQACLPARAHRPRRAPWRRCSGTPAPGPALQLAAGRALAPARGRSRAHPARRPRRAQAPRARPARPRPRATSRPRRASGWQTPPRRRACGWPTPSGPPSAARPMRHSRRAPARPGREPASAPRRTSRAASPGPSQRRKHAAAGRPLAAASRADTWPRSRNPAGGTASAQSVAAGPERLKMRRIWEASRRARCCALSKGLRQSTRRGRCSGMRRLQPRGAQRARAPESPLTLSLLRVGPNAEACRAGAAPRPPSAHTIRAHPRLKGSTHAGAGSCGSRSYTLNTSSLCLPTISAL